MKRILFLLLLFVNLHVAWQVDCLSLSFGSAAQAQSMGRECGSEGDDSDDDNGSDDESSNDGEEETNNNSSSDEADGAIDGGVLNEVTCDGVKPSSSTNTSFPGWGWPPTSNTSLPLPDIGLPDLPSPPDEEESNKKTLPNVTIVAPMPPVVNPIVVTLPVLMPDIIEQGTKNEERHEEEREVVAMDTMRVDTCQVCHKFPCECNKYKVNKDSLLAKKDSVFKAVIKKWPKTAACNQGVLKLFELIFGFIPAKMKDKKANELKRYFDSACPWHTILTQDVNTFANEGYFVVFCEENPSFEKVVVEGDTVSVQKQGHTVTVLPGYNGTEEGDIHVMDTGLWGDTINGVYTEKCRSSDKPFTEGIGKARRKRGKFYYYDHSGCDE